MVGDNRLSARFGAETTDFKQGITAINRELKLVESGFRATASTMDDWSNTSAGLEARLNSLNKSIELQKEKVSALQYKLEDMKKVHGENSVEAQTAGIEFNKESEKLGKLQTELGHTETSLNGMKNVSTGVRGAFKDLGTQFDNLKQQVPAVGTAINLLTNPISLVVAGLAAFTKVAKESITEVVAYNKMIREMTQVTGLGAEEISRIIQVGDDWGITADAIGTSLEFMNKKGITPSIDAIAKMADEYVNSTDKAKWAEEAVKTLGKGYVTLIPLLALGGDGFRDAAAGIDESMIASEDGIIASREYEVAMDDLTDTVTGLKYALGNGLIPTLVDFLSQINAVTSRVTDEEAAWKLLKKMHVDGLITQGQLTKGYFELSTGLDDLSVVQKEYNAAIAELKRKYEMAYPEEQKFVGMYKDLGPVLDGITIKTEDYTDKIGGRYSEAHREATLRAAELKGKLDNLALAEDAVMRSMENLTGYINSDFSKSQADFLKSQEDLESQMQDVQTEIDNSIRDGYDPLSTKVEELKTKYGELKTQYDENATEHEASTKRIILGVLAQQMALQGMTDPTAFAIIANNWGLIDQKAVDLTINTAKAVNWLKDHPGDYAGFMAMLNGVYTSIQPSVDAIVTLAGEIDALDGASATIEINTVKTDYERMVTLPAGWHQGDPYPRFGGGGDFIVPSGHPHSKGGYPINVESGERVIVIPPSKQFGNALANMQQLFGQSIAGLNRQPNMQVMGGSSQNVHNSWSYNIQAANPLQTSGDLVRQVRLLELMH